MKTGLYFVQEKFQGRMQEFIGSLDSIEEELSVSCSEQENDPAVVSIGSFLQGFCGNLASYFHERNGLPVGVLTAEGEMVHVFNYANRNGTRYYLDVRGMTNEWDSFVEIFERENMEFHTAEKYYGSEVAPSDIFPEDDISRAMIEWLFTEKNESLRLNDLALWLGNQFFLVWPRADEPYDIEERKKLPAYESNEVMISPNGAIVYAHPSHQEFLIQKAMERTGFSREVLMAACPPQYYFDFMEWLIPQSGGWIPVWDRGVLDHPVTQKQLAALKKMKINGFFKGKLPNLQE